MGVNKYIAFDVHRIRYERAGSTLSALTSEGDLLGRLDISGETISRRDVARVLDEALASARVLDDSGALCRVALFNPRTGDLSAVVGRAAVSLNTQAMFIVPSAGAALLANSAKDNSVGLATLDGSVVFSAVAATYDTVAERLQDLLAS